jgi:membrane protein
MTGIGGLIKQTFREFFDDGCTRLAASFSYYTIFSLPPLLVLLLVILGLVMDPEDVRSLLTGQMGGLLGPAGAGEIRNMLENAERPDISRGFAAIAGIVALLIGSVGAFVELQNALNRIWEVQPDPKAGGLKHFIGQRLMSFGMLLTIALLLLVSLAISALLSAFGDSIGRILPDALSGVVLEIFNNLVSLAVITMLFALLFRQVPDAEIDWRDVRVGAFATAILFTIGKLALGLYLGRSNPGSAFGAAGALALLLVWVYYSANIVFLGAEFTQVWATDRGKGIRPARGAIRMIETKQQIPAEGQRLTPRLRQDFAEKKAARNPRPGKRGR